MRLFDLLFDAQVDDLRPCAPRHEALFRADPQYDRVAVLDWNRHPVVPGRGSAIFLHAWRRPRQPTAGCIAFARPHLRWIAAHAVPGTRLIVPDALDRRA